MHKRSERTKLPSRRIIQRAVKRFAKEFPESPISYRSITEYLGGRDTRTSQLVGEALRDLERQGVLVATRHGEFSLANREHTGVGTISLLRNRAGLVKLEDAREIFIPPGRTQRALPGDTVRISYYFSRKYRKLEGEVVQILRRAEKTFVGTLRLAARYAFLEPDTPRMPYDIFIPLDRLRGATDGQKVVARVVEWPRTERNPSGAVVEVLGDAGVHEVEMHAILAAYDLPYRYPAEVEDFAQGLTDGLTPAEIARRRDLREVTTLTIDPTTAKDFDDAVSIRHLDDHTLEVGVHIADVSFYVRPGSPLDQEAYQRATSIYLVDRTVPMLPERLSNDICSLRPHEDKLTYSVIFKMNAQAKVLDAWMGRTVIRSDARLTYEEAQRAILGEDIPHAEEIRQLNTLAQELRKARFDHGAIDFTSGEVRFTLAPDGRPLEVVPEVYDESHQLIEELMLLANRTVAEFVAKPQEGKKIRPFVFRIHDRPDSQKLSAFCQILNQLGHKVPGNPQTITGQDITRLVRSAQGRPEQHLVDQLALRTMAKAIYSPDNIGHYGLAFDYYTHFTSPIRRYPDILAHRILSAILEKKTSPSYPELSEWCMHASNMERTATEAERASIKYKQVEFMAQHTNQDFEGIITGVADAGLFIELTENKCEGLLPIRELHDDRYHLVEEEFALVGAQRGRRFRLGDPIHVKVARTNLAQRMIDFKLYDER